MGGGFRREGTYVHLWLIPVDVWQKPTQYCKGVILQLKKKMSKKKNRWGEIRGEVSTEFVPNGQKSRQNAGISVCQNLLQEKEEILAILEFLNELGVMFSSSSPQSFWHQGPV